MSPQLVRQASDRPTTTTTTTNRSIDRSSTTFVDGKDEENQASSGRIKKVPVSERSYSLLYCNSSKFQNSSMTEGEKNLAEQKALCGMPRSSVRSSRRSASASASRSFFLRHSTHRPSVHKDFVTVRTASTGTLRVPVQ